MDNQFEKIYRGQLEELARKYAESREVQSFCTKYHGLAGGISDACERLGISACQLVLIPEVVSKDDIAEVYEYLRCAVCCIDGSVTFLWDVYSAQSNTWLIGLLPNETDESTVYGRLQPDYGDIIATPVTKNGNFYDMYNMTSEEYAGTNTRVCRLGKWETLATD